MEEMTQESPRGGFKFDASINLGNILTLLVLLVASILAWSRMDSRISNLEAETASQQAMIAKTSTTLDNLNQTLIVLNQRLSDYPLHKHVGNEIVYPGAEPSDTLQNK